MGAVAHQKKLLIFSLLAGTAIGLIAFSPLIYAIVEPHITITMDPGQTTKPFVINDDQGTEVFSVDVDGTITPSGDGGGAGAGVSGFFAKVTKSVDDVVNNSNVLVNDSELFFVGTADKTYHVTMMLYIDGPATADLKETWTLPAGASGRRIQNDNSWFYGTTTSASSDITSVINVRTFGANQQQQFHAVINMGGTTGLVNFQFAQLTAVAVDTKILKGSTLLVYEEGSEGSGIPSAGTSKIILGSISEFTTLSAFGGEDEFQIPFQSSSFYSSSDKGFIIPLDMTALTLSFGTDQNTMNVPITITLQVNQVDTSLVLTVPAGATTAQTTGSVSITEGSFVKWHVTTPSGTGSTGDNYSISMVVEA